MLVIPIFLSRGFYTLEKFFCTFLLLLALFGCVLESISNFPDFIFVEASNIKPIIKIATKASEPSIKITDKATQDIQLVRPSVPILPKNLSLSIPKIGLSQVSLVYGTNRNIPAIEKLLYNNPVIENQDAVNICSDFGNSYIFGHSEPPDITHPGNAGRIFENLDTLVTGDLLELVTPEGFQCKYKVDYWDKMVVDGNGNVNIDEYYRAMQYPEKIGKSSLTIQTCKKGSNSVRLILRASRIIG